MFIEMSHECPKKEAFDAGLPEEMRVVKAVLKADYAALAFSSKDKQSRCYDGQWLDKSEDIPAVRKHYQLFAVLCPSQRFHCLNGLDKKSTSSTQTWGLSSFDWSNTPKQLVKLDLDLRKHRHALAQSVWLDVS